LQLNDADEVAGQREPIGFAVRQVRSFGDAPLLLPLRAGYVGSKR
jgi:hypothetical protein